MFEFEIEATETEWDGVDAFAEFDGVEDPFAEFLSCPLPNL